MDQGPLPRSRRWSDRRQRREAPGTGQGGEPFRRRRSTLPRRWSRTSRTPRTSPTVSNIPENLDCAAISTVGLRDVQEGLLPVLRRRWPSSCARWGSRRGGEGFLRHVLTRTPASRPSRSAAPTRRSRSTSRVSAGSCSTRPAATCRRSLAAVGEADRGRRAPLQSRVHSADGRRRRANAGEHGKRRLGPAPLSLPWASPTRPSRPTTWSWSSVSRRRRRRRRRDRQQLPGPYRKDRVRSARRHAGPCRRAGDPARTRHSSAATRSRRRPSPPTRTALRRSTSSSTPTARVCSPTTPRTTSVYLAITMDGSSCPHRSSRTRSRTATSRSAAAALTGLDAMRDGLVALIGSGELPVPLALTSSSVLGVPSPAASTP